MGRFQALYDAIRSDDPLLRFEILRRVARVLLPTYRFKYPQMAWWHDAAFNLFLRRFNETTGMNTDRRWMLSQLLRIIQVVPGDTAECGVYQGASSFFICKMTEQTTPNGRQHLIFDSFEGLSAPTSVDGKHWKKGDLSYCLDSVRENLRDCVNVTYYKGWIPERFSDAADRTFAFVHIDVDLYEPTLECIKFFYPRTNAGGVIVCDDYGVTNCPGATRAIDEFLADKPEKMLACCGGGGFLIKGCRTSAAFSA